MCNLGGRRLRNFSNRFRPGATVWHGTLRAVRQWQLAEEHQPDYSSSSMPRYRLTHTTIMAVHEDLKHFNLVL